MGIIEEIVAKGLTQAWGLMSDEQKANIRMGTMAGEEALATFNDITEDGTVEPAELEKVIIEIMGAMDSVSGRAIQAFFWSLFKSG